MNLDWCCAEFEAHCCKNGRKVNGLGICVLIHSMTGVHFLLEFRRPGRIPSEPIAKNGIKLKFCLWCGCNLVERYAKFKKREQ